MCKTDILYVFWAADSESGIKKRFWPPVWPAPAIFSQFWPNFKNQYFDEKTYAFYVFGVADSESGIKKMFYIAYNERKKFHPKNFDISIEISEILGWPTTGYGPQPAHLHFI